MCMKRDLMLAAVCVLAAFACAAPAGETEAPAGWTSETRRVETGTPNGDRGVDIVFYRNTTGMEFVWIAPGEYMMGSRRTPREIQQLYGGETYWFEREHPCHRVKLTEGFWLAATPVTQAQWEDVMGSNPSHFQGPDRPVEGVSWHDAMEFSSELSEMEGLYYQLPTEAQWEYAARAGTDTEFYFGDDAERLGDYAWYAGNSGEETHPVARKKPNSWGLYDMHGNVWEWCLDWYAEYTPGLSVDPRGPHEGERRLLGEAPGLPQPRTAARHAGGVWNPITEPAVSVSA